MHLPNLDNYILQEYIENFEEYTVDCYISREGEIPGYRAAHTP